MSEAQNLPATNDASQLSAVPTRPVREYRVVESTLGIMDTARFEHLSRVATVMARAGLMPQSLTHAKEGSGDNAPLTELPYEVIQARAFLISNQADLFHMDPNALAQCVSIVHGKLMYEGKLVHALISERLGIDLIYEFGRYDSAKRDILGTLEVTPAGERIWTGEMPTSVDDQGLGVRVLGTLPGERAPRWIAGSVAMWHKGNKSPWQSANAWPRQLRYMGAREWCRAYKPSLLLGVMTDDEVDEYDLGRQVGHIAPAAPQLLHAGFEDVRTAQVEQPAPKPRAGRRKAPEPAPQEPERPTQEEPTTETAGAPDAGFTPATSETATDASTDGAAASSSPLTSSEAQEPGQSEAEVPAEQEIAADTGEERPTEDEDEEEEDGFPPEFAQYIGQVEEAKSFADVKRAMADFYKSDVFKALSVVQQNKVRENTWATCVEKNLSDLPDHATDVSAFRLWIEYVEEPDAIQGTLSVLETQPAFETKDDTFKNAIRKAVADRIAVIVG